MVTDSYDDASSSCGKARVEHHVVGRVARYPWEQVPGKLVHEAAHHVVSSDRFVRAFGRFLSDMFNDVLSDGDPAY